MRRLAFAIMFAILFVSAFAWGALVIRNHVFPYHPVRNAALSLGLVHQSEPRAARRAEMYRLFAPDVDVVFFGDSITRYADWQDIFPDFHVANRGISGDTTEGMLQRVDNVLALRPRAVFVMGGVNDLSGGASVDAVFGNYRALVRTISAEGIRVVIQSTLYCSTPACPTDRIAALNSRLSAQEWEGDVRFVSLNDVLANGQRLRPELTNDGLHLLPEAYVLWRDAISQEVSSSRNVATVGESPK